MAPKAPNGKGSRMSWRDGNEGWRLLTKPRTGAQWRAAILFWCLALMLPVALIAWVVSSLAGIR